MGGEHAHTVTGVGLSAEPLSRIQHGDAREGKLLLSMRIGCFILCFHMFFVISAVSFVYHWFIICYLCSVNIALSAQTLWYWRHFPKESYS